MISVYLSLGSNIGDKKAYLEAALERLNQLPQTSLAAVSSFYETAAWGKTDQDDFLNICCQLKTELAAQQLLIECQQIEKDLHRVRHEHWGPRTIDIDILLYGSEHIATENLKVPHPYMTERAFVLVPLFEIAPSLEICGHSITSYLKTLNLEEVRKLQS
ncbi:2-amino-4-hydroxy-6-hydroxymethyldihydropteridine diphosphokinase [Streptococcus lutetiensis]|uniref:2-amino-4-hydroxy-6- hydroxymethyldihydropteridine diphosphokinase n=1 Tax=Streptococcus lutetiensis TaxID=150055 RepID=UPI0008B867C8|nr:2-amino-4-hydroxy-6-hydroxymethyldihydropteridine diphosphokinase [Streptococcus lutetiensis]SEP55958.1 2-amino-4-hydroxy-6-hydroxymethyldihydropteridinediphosphokinase [Streptococcus equinus]